MIRDLDATLHELLTNDVPALPGSPPTAIATDQVAFRPPDDSWRSYVTSSLKRLALNVYLVDVHENAKLRSNERVRVYDHGIVAEEQASLRLDCHYLVTAWSPALETAGQSDDEHQLLYQAARALLARRPLVPAAIWGGSLPTGFQLTEDMELPMTVAPTEGYAHLSYFWSAMGPDALWKPALSLIVTLPVLVPRLEYGPPVTTALAEVGLNGGVAIDRLVAVGGRVLDATGVGEPVPVPGAQVTVETARGQRIDTAETNAEGRYRLGRLGPGTYELRVLATGLGTVHDTVTVPSPTGEYDLRFG